MTGTTFKPCFFGVGRGAKMGIYAITGLGTDLRLPPRPAGHRSLGQPRSRTNEPFDLDSADKQQPYLKNDLNSLSDGVSGFRTPSTA
ncbi:unnamed protein product [Protopolystoma xenopodis]|uniref:Uncharacterized protein n=1 Tax=Protopolystoma xenopodis TaxID=117903 RepID=A0A448WSN0_9PLAT|nr:unnamed protein product [Protopolystoma xenopodis]